MSSYFEIDGVIIECEDEESLPRIPNPLMGRWEVEEITRGELRDLEVDAKYEKEHHAVAAGGDPEMASADKWGRRTLGQGLVRIGAIGLMVPDPIPLVDEVIFGGMIVLGVAIHATTW